MRVMVIGRATKETEAGILPDEKGLLEMQKFNEELIKAGILVGGEGLQSSAQGKRVRISGSNRTVIDGPFTETKEIIAGFMMWQVKSMDEAVEWVMRSPNLSGEDTVVEIRRVFELEDFEPSIETDAGRALMESELANRDREKA